MLSATANAASSRPVVFERKLFERSKTSRARVLKNNPNEKTVAMAMFLPRSSISKASSISLLSKFNEEFGVELFKNGACVNVDVSIAKKQNKMCVIEITT